VRPRGAATGAGVIRIIAGPGLLVACCNQLCVRQVAFVQGTNRQVALVPPDLPPPPAECGVCGQRRGLVIKCHHGDCQKRFHALCGVQNGHHIYMQVGYGRMTRGPRRACKGLMSVVLGVVWQPKDSWVVFMWCPAHGEKAAAFKHADGWYEPEFDYRDDKWRIFLRGSRPGRCVALYPPCGQAGEASTSSGLV
jgi:hypothetical protein